jgi:hypothetical protein
MVLLSMDGGNVVVETGSCQRCGAGTLEVNEWLLAEPPELAAPEAEPEQAPARVRVISLEEFAATEEAGARSLVGNTDEALIPEGGDVLVYGDGGAGKTTMMIDAAMHFAAGDEWLGFPVAQPLRVLLIENEGPRPLLRAKLRRKLESWQGSPIERRVQVYEEPWAAFSFADAAPRAQLAAELCEQEIDIAIIGPATRVGMDEAGTLQDVRDFMRLVADVRRLAGRPVAFVLIHHENKAGKVSGAWEGAGDTLLHVSGQGHGRTRLYVQKARWATAYHATTLQLVWTPGEGFALAEADEVTDDPLCGELLAAIGSNPGAGWTRIEEATPGVNRERRRAVRDGLLAAGLIANIAKVDGVEAWLSDCPERKTARLYLADDPTIRHLRPEPGAGGAQTAPPKPADNDQRLRPAPRPMRGAEGAAAVPPASTKSSEEYNCVAAWVLERVKTLALAVETAHITEREFATAYAFVDAVDRRHHNVGGGLSG